ncbi:MAG: hypothetical protein ABJN64_02610 [Tateyamaria sp.]
MSIIAGLLSLLIVAAVVGLFKKKFRKRAAFVLVGAFAAFAVVQSAEKAKLDVAAQKAGYLDHLDLVAAGEAGVASSEEWELSRADREEAVREQAERDRRARECGERQHISAFVMSQNPVSTTLRAPSTADFPSFSSIRVTSVGSCRFRVDAYVDAQNGFGAQIRTQYQALMERDPDADTWQLIELDF